MAGEAEVKTADVDANSPCHRADCRWRLREAVAGTHPPRRPRPVSIRAVLLFAQSGQHGPTVHGGGGATVLCGQVRRILNDLAVLSIASPNDPGVPPRPHSHLAVLGEFLGPPGRAESGPAPPDRQRTLHHDTLPAGGPS